MTWRRVDGQFERGGERVNRVEAAAIVDEIRTCLASDADASIGVVTFNTQQRDLILDLLEECADNRVAAALTSDGEELFVKNLENVQGDERDVIPFSLAFSPNPDTGRLPLNFGPLIQAGGERRLNVAVTRARAQVVLFSSFDPAHLDLSRSASVGLAHLRSYMEAAQRHASDAGVLRPATARDRHHDDVVSALRELACTHASTSDSRISRSTSPSLQPRTAPGSRYSSMAPTTPNGLPSAIAKPCPMAFSSALWGGRVSSASGFPTGSATPRKSSPASKAPPRRRLRPICRQHPAPRSRRRGMR